MAYDINIQAWETAFDRLPALAVRLGVSQCTEHGKWVIRTGKGEQYEIFELINKLLDRLDAASVGNVTEIEK